MKLPSGLLIFISVLGILVAPHAVDAEQAGKVYRIGFLSAYSPPTPEEIALSPFHQALRELGWNVGQNVVIERRYASGNIQRLPELATDLVRLKVDVIVAFTNLEIAAAKQATGSIPIVMLFATDPVGAGFVASLSRPGGNVTGTTFHTPEFMGKVLETIKQAVPRVARIAIVWNPDYQRHEAAYLEEAAAAARALGVTLQFVEIRQARDVATAFVKIRNGHADALYLLSDPVTWAHQAQFIELAARDKVPAVYTASRYVDAGGLMYYGPRFIPIFQGAAVFVDKILKGAKPADLPVEQSTKFELVINLKTATALGLTIPQSLLLQADKVIK